MRSKRCRESQPQPRGRPVLVATLALLAGATLQLVWLTRGGAFRFESFPLDDAWIHQVFARSLAEGRGLSYSGGVPSAGCSSPLWAFVLSMPLRLGVNPVGAGSAMSAIATLLALGGAGVLASRLLTGLVPPPHVTWIAPLAILLTSLVPTLAWNAASGMEGPAAAAAVIWGLALRRGTSERERSLGAVLLGFGIALRLEIATVLPLLAVDGWLARARGGRATRALRVATDLTLGVLPPLLVLGWMHSATGHFLPQTFEAKVGDLALWRVAQAPGSNFLPILAERLVSGLAAVVRIATLDSVFSAGLLGLLVLGVVRLRSRQALFALVLPGGLLLVQPLAMELLPQPGGTLAHEGRYAVHLQLLAASLLALGVSLGVHLAALEKSARARHWAIAATAVTGVIWFFLGANTASRAEANRREIAHLQVALGRWLGKHAPDRAAIAARDVGAAAYFAPQARIVDLYGLVSPEVLVARRAGLEPTRPPDVSYVEIFSGEWPGWIRGCSELTRADEPLATHTGRRTMLIYGCPTTTARAAP